MIQWNPILENINANLAQKISMILLFLFKVAFIVKFVQGSRCVTKGIMFFRTVYEDVSVSALLISEAHAQLSASK